MLRSKGAPTGLLVQALLGEGEAARSEGEEAGPDTELEFWRQRMAKFNSVTEQLKSHAAKLVLGVCGAARSKQVGAPLERSMHS